MGGPFYLDTLYSVSFVRNGQRSHSQRAVRLSLPFDVPEFSSRLDADVAIVPYRGVEGDVFLHREGRLYVPVRNEDRSAFDARSASERTRAIVGRKWTADNSSVYVNRRDHEERDAVLADARKVVKDGHEDASATLAETAARLAWFDGVLHERTHEPAYLVTGSPSLGFIPTLVPSEYDHRSLQLFRADRYEDAVLYGREWCRATGQEWPGGDPACEVLRPDLLSLDDVGICARNAIENALRFPSNGDFRHLSDEALTAYMEVRRESDLAGDAVTWDPLKADALLRKFRKALADTPTRVPGASDSLEGMIRFMRAGLGDFPLRMKLREAESRKVRDADLAFLPQP